MLVTIQNAFESPQSVKSSECICDNSNCIGTHQWYLKTERQMRRQNAFERAKILKRSVCLTTQTTLERSNPQNWMSHVSLWHQTVFERHKIALRTCDNSNSINTQGQLKMNPKS